MSYRQHVPCVGGQFHSLKSAIEVGAVDAGKSVKLVREPQNQYDENAVAVFSTEPEMQIGYVKKNFAADLAPMMDKGKKFKASILMVRANSLMLDIEEESDEKAS